MKSRNVSICLAIVNILILSYLFVIAPLVAEGNLGPVQGVPAPGQGSPAVVPPTEKPVTTATVTPQQPVKTPAAPVQPVETQLAGRIRIQINEPTIEIGDTLGISGTNTISGTTYLFIRGKGTKGADSPLHDTHSTVVLGNASSFTTAPVSGGSWKYSWNTASFGYPVGTYEIVASPFPSGSTALKTGEYSSANFIMRAPVKIARPLIDDGDSGSDGGGADSV